jgi:hypothetical protein
MINVFTGRNIFCLSLSFIFPIAVFTRKAIRLERKISLFGAKMKKQKRKRAS